MKTFIRNKEKQDNYKKKTEMVYQKLLFNC